MPVLQGEEKAKAIEAFFNAIEHGRLDDARKTIATHPEAVNWEYANGFAPLHWALISGLKEGMLQFTLELIEKGADPNKRQPIPYGPPMLPYCLGWSNGEEIALKLIEHGADLSWKSEPGSEKELEKLAETFTSLTFLSGHGATLLMSAAGSGSVKLAEALLEKGADLHAKDSRGQTAIMYAAQSGKPDIVEFLISRGANLQDCDDAGKAITQIAEEGLYKCAVAPVRDAFTRATEAVTTSLIEGCERPIIVSRNPLKLKRNTP
jgi:ankyrin repeat protein